MGETAPVNFCAPQTYRPREPQKSPYYQCVEDNFESFEQVYDELFSTKYGFFRPYTKEVIYRYLDCGDLHHGFARVKCPDYPDSQIPPWDDDYSDPDYPFEAYM